MKRLLLLALLMLVPLLASATASLSTGTVESVATYEDCLVIKLAGQSNVYVYPLANASANAKLAIALSALHAETTVQVAYWGTGTCASLDSEPSVAPSGTRYYLYSINVIK